MGKVEDVVSEMTNEEIKYYAELEADNSQHLMS